MNGEKPHPTRPSDTPVTPVECLHCHCDLRGIFSNRCPECGARTDWRTLYFHEPLLFKQARVTLLQGGVPHQVRDFSWGISGLLGAYLSNPNAGEIRFLDSDADAVYAALDAADIPMQYPIVDRQEPACPRCQCELDPTGDSGELSGGPEHCPSCGSRFNWVDIEEPELSTEGKTCDCGYLLTGLTSDRCPECGEKILFAVDEVAALALKQIEEREDDSPANPDHAAISMPSIERAILTILFVGGLILLFIYAILQP